MFSRCTIDDSLGEWIFDNFIWAIERFPDQNWLEKPLVLPTKEFFSAKRGSDQETAEAILKELKHIIGLNELTIKIEALPSQPDEHTIDYSSMSEIAGQYYHDEFEPLITYNSRLLESPIPFISTMAHELMHAKLSPYVENLPGGEATHELATDLHCIIDGFGIFQLMSAEQVGWSGYMTRESRAFALAIFLHSKGHSLNDLHGYISSRSYKAVKRAWKELNYWKEELEELAAYTA